MKKKVLLFSFLVGFALPAFSQEFSNAFYINYAEMLYGMTIGSPTTLALGAGYERAFGDYSSLRANFLFAKSLFPSPESNNLSLLFINPEIGFRWYPMRNAIKGWFIESGVACLYLEAQEDHFETKEECEKENVVVGTFLRTGWKWLVLDNGLFIELGLGIGASVYSNTFRDIRSDGMLWASLLRTGLAIKYFFWLELGWVF